MDTSRPIKGLPAGSSLKDVGYDEVGMDEGWAACPPSPSGHGRDPSVDSRAKMPRQIVKKPFDIGDNKTSLFHRLNSDGTLKIEMAWPNA